MKGLIKPDCGSTVWSARSLHLYVCHVLLYCLDLHRETNVMFRASKTGLSTHSSFLITQTCLYKFDLLKPNFYIVKLGFARV